MLDCKRAHLTIQIADARTISVILLAETAIANPLLEEVMATGEAIQLH